MIIGNRKRLHFVIYKLGKVILRGETRTISNQASELDKISSEIGKYVGPFPTLLRVSFSPHVVAWCTLNKLKVLFMSCCHIVALYKHYVV